MRSDLWSLFLTAHVVLQLPGEYPVPPSLPKHVFPVPEAALCTGEWAAATLCELLWGGCMTSNVTSNDLQ